CGQCGTNADWAKTRPKWKPVLAARLEVHGPKGLDMPEGTPLCGSKRYTREGVENTCGARSWRHNGTKLTYCGKCGANYTGAQPENVAEIIKAIGNQSRDYEQPIGKRFGDKERRKLEAASRES